MRMLVEQKNQFFPLQEFQNVQSSSSSSPMMSSRLNSSSATSKSLPSHALVARKLETIAALSLLNFCAFTRPEVRPLVAPMAKAASFSESNAAEGTTIA